MHAYIHTHRDFETAGTIGPFQSETRSELCVCFVRFERITRLILSSGGCTSCSSSGGVYKSFNAFGMVYESASYVYVHESGRATLIGAGSPGFDAIVKSHVHPTTSTF